MLIWIVFAVLAACAAALVLMPLRRPRPADDASPGGADAAVYRDQLAEIERERITGQIGAEEAVAARAEIARRLIALRTPETGGTERPSQVSPPAGRMAAALAAAGIPLFSVAVYLATGQPDLPGQPLASRADRGLEGRSIDTLVTQVESHLARNPEDGAGWEVLAPVYLRLGHADDAIRARQNALRILGPTAARHAGLGEAIVAREGGIVTAAARRAFQAARALDPAAPMPRFYLALAYEQDGAHAEAADAWRALLRSAPPDAPWRGEVAAAVARTEAAAKTADGAGRGPTADDVAAAAAMSEADRQAMIDGMVERLAGRLAEDGDDAEGWLRLVRAYAVLGRPQQAAGAARSALEAISDADGRRRVAALAAELGIDVAAAGEPTP